MRGSGDILKIKSPESLIDYMRGMGRVRSQKELYGLLGVAVAIMTTE